MRIYFFCLILGFFFIGWISLKFYQFKKLQGLTPLWLGFKRKMWMTIGLGSFFLFCYFLFILAVNYLMTKKTSAYFFFLIYQSPTLWIYRGLWVFACLSLCIYLIRMFIKSYFLLKGKDE